MSKVNKKNNSSTRLCSGVSQLSHHKFTSNDQIPLEEYEKPLQNIARKQEWREPFTLGANSGTLNSAYGHKFDTNRTKIRIWMKYRIFIERHSDSMQIAGQKPLSRTFPIVQESSHKLIARLHLIDNYFIFLFLSSNKSFTFKKSRMSKGPFKFRGNSSEDLPSEDNSWTHMENREHQITAEQHGTQSFESQTTRDVAERRGTISKDPIGASTTHDGLITRTARENEAAAIKGNQGINHGINQSTERRGRNKVSGCSRNPASGGSQLSSEEPK